VTTVGGGSESEAVWSSHMNFAFAETLQRRNYTNSNKNDNEDGEESQASSISIDIDADAGHLSADGPSIGAAK
jgi:hypothetical protein